MKPPLKQHSTSTSYNDNYITYSAIEGVSLAFFNYLDTKDGSELGFQCVKRIIAMTFIHSLHGVTYKYHLILISSLSSYTRDHEYLVNLKPISTSLR